MYDMSDNAPPGNIPDTVVEVDSAVENHPKEEKRRVRKRSGNRNSVDCHCQETKEIPNPPPLQCFPPKHSDPCPEARILSVRQLSAFQALTHPIWVFSLKERRVQWANRAGVKMFFQESLECLHEIRFDHIAETSLQRLEETMSHLCKGLHVSDHWVMRPKGKSRSIPVHISAIRLSPEEEGFSMFCESCPTVSNKLLNENWRGVELLRQLPMAICQFDMDGNMLFQNPEGTLQNSTASNGSNNSAVVEDATDSTNHSTDEDSLSVANTSSDQPSYEKSPGKGRSKRRQRPENLVGRFVDPEVGRQVLREIQMPTKTNVTVEATVRTLHGSKWSSVEVRRVLDPLHGDEILLYTSKDLSDVIRAKEEREERERKSELLAIMAHEIRNPLQQILGFTELLNQTQATPEQKSFIELLGTSAKGLVDVISDVLDYSKLEAGKMKMESIPFEPFSVVRATVEESRTFCEQKNLSIQLDWNPDLPSSALGDPTRLKQIFSNLLSNALRFTDKGGITVRAAPTTVPHFQLRKLPRSRSARLLQSTMLIRFEVVDTGVGISAEHKDLIFRKFKQVNINMSRSLGGTGLGLSICQLLVDQMGGFIGVDSVLGQGACFWFVLPVVVPLNQKVKSSSPAMTKRKQTQQSMRVLVAEDNHVNQKLVSHMLQRMGHHATIAANGEEAVHLATKNEYDVVLMDLQMPVMDGIEATRKLRAMGYLKLPIIGLSGSDARPKCSSEVSFNDWMVKPIQMVTLKRMLGRFQPSNQPRIEE
eukprot:Nitzschia sp. Nitz4//scaffold87_size112219//58747//61035//NITZ4_004077-RA/size112219-processed-gene-0.25-mRNA-1//-1//CDS//3329559378//4215//frame0